MLFRSRVAFARLRNAGAEHAGVNRVALRHMTYKRLREQFPAIGSQIVCNAIYSVSRHRRALFQSSGSPFNIAQVCERSLPLLRFIDSCLVYFVATLSLKGRQLSMYTLDGRIRFQVYLPPEAEAHPRGEGQAGRAGVTHGATRVCSHSSTAPTTPSCKRQ